MDVKLMPQTPRDVLVEAETDQAIFLECADRLKLAEEVESINRQNGIDDLEFADGQQWPDDIYNARGRNQVSLTINHTATLVRRVVNNMRQQRPRAKVHPVGGGVRIEDARVAAGLIRHVETLSNASVAYDTGGESAVRIGWGYWRVVGDYADETSFDQELYIRSVRNTFTGYIDPAAQMPDGSDMDWFIFSTKMKKAEFKRQYPDVELNEWIAYGAGDNQSQWENKEEIRLAEYYRVKKIKDTLVELSDGRAMFKSEYTKAFQLAGLTIMRSRPTERRQIQWFRINGTKVVDKRDLPGHWIPVVRCEGNVMDLNGQVRRKGMIRDIKDPARMVNYWESSKTAKLALSSKAPWVMAEGQSDGHPEWDDANQKAYSSLKYKLILGLDGNPIPGVPPPQRQQAVEVEAGFAEAMNSAMQHMMAVAGMPHEPVQDTPGQVVSGVALRRRQAISDISHFQYYDNQTMAIAHTARILLDLFPHYYGEERMQRIIGEDGVPQMVPINQQKVSDQGIVEIKNNMGVGRYDVVMDTGPGYETKRQESAESMLDLLKTPLGEPITKSGADLVVRNMDFAGADDLADRLMPMNEQGMKKAVEALPKEAQGIVQALMAQNSQKDQAIQHLQLELKYKMGIEKGWQETELKKAHISATVKAHDTEMRDHTAERDTQVKSHTQLLVAEVGAAGQLLNTNTEAGHDRAAAREMVKTAETAEREA
jgi:hypothetical protein